MEKTSRPADTPSDTTAHFRDMLTRIQEENRRLKHRVERVEKQLALTNSQLLHYRNHPFFQIGEAMVQVFTRPWGLWCLPGRLYNAVRAARVLKSRPALSMPSWFTNAPPASRSVDEKRTICSVKGFSEDAYKSSAHYLAALRRLRMMTIMDEFSFHAFSLECHAQQVTPQNWRETLATFKPQILMVESAWLGEGGAWHNRVNHPGPEFEALLAACREAMVPTVFWNKEDPVHFQTFINTASLFDHVFTTDLECIPRYQSLLGHRRVYLLPFACQPKTHNPVEIGVRKDAACFAGAYYVRYPERTRDLEHFVETLPCILPVEIYDRNFGKNDANYAFPPSYQPLIVGNLPAHAMDKAYKGYNFAINLNSIKQSQTMFARRIFELLACNTLTISNDSVGVRLLFGNLVLCGDDALEHVDTLSRLRENPIQLEKLRLWGLRRVMSEHTVTDRLAHVLACVGNTPARTLWPSVRVIAAADTLGGCKRLIAQFNRQHFSERTLWLVVSDAIDYETDSPNIVLIRETAARARLVVEDDDWYAVMVDGDYYGPHYLTDLVSATRFAASECIGKTEYFAIESDGTLSRREEGQAFRYQEHMPLRRAFVRSRVLAGESLGMVLEAPESRILQLRALAIDAFSYCENANVPTAELLETVDFSKPLQTGISMHELNRFVKTLKPESQPDMPMPMLAGKTMARWLRVTDARVDLSENPAGLALASSLQEGQHLYAVFQHDFALNECVLLENRLDFHLDTTPGLHLQAVIWFINARGEKNGHIIKSVNTNHTVFIPENTARLRIGLRIQGSGRALVHGLIMGHKPLFKPLAARSDTLLLTNHYPSTSDLYRNAFVHSRVLAYHEAGKAVDVFRLRENMALQFHTFEGILCASADLTVLDAALESGQYKTVLVHFLDESLWKVLKKYIERVRVVVWVHGAEIQPVSRRMFNHTTPETLARATLKSEQRMRFWRELFSAFPNNLHVVFVSAHFAREVFADTGITLSPSAFSIIHNPIQTDRFVYVPKPASQRMRVLSIRPYASRTYANDLTVRAILALSEHPEFLQFEFLLTGDGALFEETLEPLRSFTNVRIERGFLEQKAIAALHREYGIFLCPTRMDTQGVSRDEAMASGLVPVTTSAGAIPEFVDEHCGVVVPLEDWQAMADALLHLYHHPHLFEKLSKAAAERVRAQSCHTRMIARELALPGMRD